jgi:hypothetical protein
LISPTYVCNPRLYPSIDISPASVAAASRRRSCSIPRARRSRRPPRCGSSPLAPPPPRSRSPQHPPAARTLLTDKTRRDGGLEGDAAAQTAPRAQHSPSAHSPTQSSVSLWTATSSPTASRTHCATTAGDIATLPLDSDGVDSSLYRGSQCRGEAPDPPLGRLMASLGVGGRDLKRASCGVVHTTINIICGTHDTDVGHATFHSHGDEGRAVRC